MQTLEQVVSWIARLVEAGDPDVVRKTRKEADEYLAPFGDMKAITEERIKLADALRQRLPRTKLADEVIKAVADGAK